MTYIKYTPLKSSRNISLVSSVQCNPVAKTFPTPRTELLGAFKESQPYCGKQGIGGVRDCVI